MFDTMNMYLPDDDQRSTYQIYTRRVCNMVYQNETFRTVDKKSSEYLVEKNKEYKILTDGELIKFNKGLQNYSNKFNRIFLRAWLVPKLQMKF